MSGPIGMNWQAEMSRAEMKCHAMTMRRCAHFCRKIRPGLGNVP